ncbi:hypothetical protein HQ520_04900, partial [bacterium]|nr:hypothetical protein [bacterium]
ELVIVQFALGVWAAVMQRRQQIHDPPEKSAALHIAGIYSRLTLAASGAWRLLVHGAKMAAA